MNPMRRNIKINIAKGFTLIELAMVMFIITLLLGGLLTPLSTQLEIKQRNEVDDSLEKINEALLGFAIINGRLPCPTTQADPANANYGLEQAPCVAAVAADGYLPWRTLGLVEIDPWGTVRTAAADPWTGYWRYRVDTNFTNAITLNTGFAQNMVIQDSNGNLLTSPTENPIAIIYSTGADRLANGQNNTYEAANCGNVTGYDDEPDGNTACPQGEPLYQGGGAAVNFDDILVWLTRPRLFNRMVTSGRLP